MTFSAGSGKRPPPSTLPLRRPKFTELDPGQFEIDGLETRVKSGLEPGSIRPKITVGFGSYP
jgi:hypothetical protein